MFVLWFYGLELINMAFLNSSVFPHLLRCFLLYIKKKGFGAGFLHRLSPVQKYGKTKSMPQPAALLNKRYISVFTVSFTSRPYPKSSVTLAMLAVPQPFPQPSSFSVAAMINTLLLFPIHITTLKMVIKDFSSPRNCLACSSVGL